MRGTRRSNINNHQLLEPQEYILLHVLFAFLRVVARQIVTCPYVARQPLRARRGRDAALLNPSLTIPPPRPLFGGGMITLSILSGYVVGALTGIVPLLSFLREGVSSAFLLFDSGGPVYFIADKVLRVGRPSQAQISASFPLLVTMRLLVEQNRRVLIFEFVLPFGHIFT